MLTLEQVKSKSQAKINTLQEPLKTAATILVENCYKRGVYVIITEALRTIEYQNQLYAQGRTKPGSIVTNARGGYSNHNFGYAFDFALLNADGRTVSWDTVRDLDKDGIKDWDEVVYEGKQLGLEWGGDWNFVDLPHFQMVFGLSTSDYRNGKRPTSAQVNAALAKMVSKTLKEEDYPMTSDEKKAFDELKSAFNKQQEIVKEQADLINKLSKKINLSGNQTPPPWATPYIEAIKAIDDSITSNDKSQVFFEVIATLVKTGVIPEVKK